MDVPRIDLRRLLGLALASCALAFASLGAPGASAHRSGCHGAHSCPSDHATYRWHGRLCVKPGAPEDDGSFRRRVTYAGLPYRCR